MIVFSKNHFLLETYTEAFMGGMIFRISKEKKDQRVDEIRMAECW